MNEADVTPAEKLPPAAVPEPPPLESPPRPAPQDLVVARRVGLLWVGAGESAKWQAEEAAAAVQRRLPSAETFLVTGKGAELRGQLIEKRCTGLVVFGLGPDSFLKIQSRCPWRLADGLRAGVQTFGYLCNDGNYQQADRRQVIADLLGPIGAPYTAWQTARSIWAQPEDREDPILSFSGGVNGWMACRARARWLRQCGLFGLAYNSYLGHPGVLVDPPLGPWLLGKLGLRNLTLVVLAAMAVGLLLLGMFEASLFTLLLTPFVLGNRALLDPLLRTGRIEPLGFALVVLAAAALAPGFTLVAVVLLGVAMLTAPIPATVGVVALLGCLWRDRFGFDMLWYVVLAAPVVAFWWWPFLAHGWEKTSTQRADVQSPDIQRLTRRLRTMLAPATALVLAALFLGGAGFATLGLGCVVAAGLWVLVKGRYPLHPATFDLAVLVTGMFAVAWSSGLVTPLVYLVLLWFLQRVESPVEDAAGYVRPARFGPQVEAIRYLVSELPATSRVALEFPGPGGSDHDHGFDWLFAHALAEKDGIELLSGVEHDHVAPELRQDYVQHMNLDEGDAKLQEQMIKVGTQYLITTTPELGSQLGEVGFKKLRAVELSGFEKHGVFREGQTLTLRLFEARRRITRITPEVALDRKPNQLSFPAKGGQRYLLKYAYYRGWKVTDGDGKELLVNDAQPGMWITVPSETTVHLRHVWWHYFTR